MLDTGQGLFADGGHDLPVDAPDHDLDGDGLADTIVLDSPAGGMAMMSDLDGDGYADHITTIDDDGSCESWVLMSGDSGTDSHWHMIDSDHL